MPGDQNNGYCRKHCSDQRSRDGDHGTAAASMVLLGSVLQNIRPKAPESREKAKREVDVDGDGTLYTGPRDPPGQSSVYVAPGDQRNESYRLSTFSRWSCDIPASPNNLAAHGFYYTGFRDRVKCYSCGICVENWIIGDDEGDAKWHKDDCLLAKGVDTENVPTQTTKMKRQFPTFFKSTTVIKQSFYPYMSCSIQQHEAASNWNQARGDAMVVDCLSTRPKLENALPRQHEIDRDQALRIADIPSPEHERLIYTLNLTKEIDRRKTFAKWPSYPAPALANKLAEEGFFYLGNLDRAQCFSCSGVLRNWAAPDDPRTEHRKHFPHCRIVLGQETRNIPISAHERQRMDEEERLRIAALMETSPVEPPDPSVDEQSFLARHFPCIYPINRDMENEDSRIATFNSAWPAHKTKATPRQIANAGFFFLGTSDKTKCFYCNGGLQNWEFNDEPWTEHGKWFPGCEFVLRRKGTKFVRDLVEANPNLNRPTIRNAVSYEIEYTAPSFSAAATTSPEPPRAQTREELRQLIAERLCKNCFKEAADNLAQPCGHIALCSTCVPRRTTCPICNRRVQCTIKVFRP